MDLAKGLLTVLDNNDEPLLKRIKIADNAFKSSELPLQHRESFLIKWILNKNVSNKETWSLLNNWLNSEHFKELNRNDINNEDINAIIKLITISFQSLSSVDTDLKNTILNTILLLFENRIFQQYFKFYLDDYCTLVSSILKQIDCPVFFLNFIKNEHLFHKNIIIGEQFYKKFLDNILPVMVTSLVKFKSTPAFEEVSKIVQKCIFYRNSKIFEIYLGQFFDETSQTEKHSLPKALIKFLVSAYNLDPAEAKISYKLLFHAFCKSYHDFGLVFKLFVILNNVIGFDLEDCIELQSPKLNKLKLVLSKSLNILLELFRVLSETKQDTEFKIKELNLDDFIKNILKSIMSLSKPNSVCYEIFASTILINPLIIESIVNELIVFAMLADNKSCQKDYENFIISLFQVFSKLHRIQNFVSKMVPTLKAALDGQNILIKKYPFKGTNDITREDLEKFNITNIFSQEILNYFTQCVTNLASWQVINLFKTLLHHLNVAVLDIPNIKDEPNQLIYVEILSTLTCWLLSSVRMAENTVPSNVVAKFVGGLEELKNILGKYGKALLHREHSHVLMHAFLNICFNWAEIYTALAYYTINKEVDLKHTVDNDATTCNITYLHSYLTVKQWCLISERITNFGEKPCKQLLNKLYLQKIKAMLIFEQSVNDDVVVNVTKSISTNLEDNWQDLVGDKYVVNNLLARMESSNVLFLAESLIKDYQNFGCQPHLTDSALIVNAINYVAISKINKLFNKQKRKLDKETATKTFSAKIYACITEDLFLSNADGKSCIDKAREVFTTANELQNSSEINLNDSVKDYLEVLEKFPIIFGREDVQKVFLLYLFALHTDIVNGNGSEILKNTCESVIIGVLQQYKFRLLDTFEAEYLFKLIVNNFNKHETVFTYLIENVFKNEFSIKKFEPCVQCLKDNLNDPKYLQCGILILNAVNKLKKTKMTAAAKNTAATYKNSINDKIVKQICKKAPENNLLEAYAHALKNLLSKDENDNLSKVLQHLDAYTTFALEKVSCDNFKGHLMLFSTILHQKTAIKTISDDLTLKIWCACKKLNTQENCEEYSLLIMLIFEQIPNDDFSSITSDLLNITSESVQKNNLELFCKHLLTWESILACSFNPVKNKVWQNVLECLLQEIITVLQNAEYCEKLFKSIVKFQEVIIQTNQLHLTSAMIDMLILSVTLLMDKESHDFYNIFCLSRSILESLLKSRKPLIMDRLAPYLQQYRLLLRSLCVKSNSDLNLDTLEVQKMSDCAHRLENLTKNLVGCQKDMARISMYLIADILEQYEQITLYPNVKMHLNNCIHSLISLCDQHAVAYLMRVLSSASTEIFKVMYEHYNKYYRFTGKV